MKRSKSRLRDRRKKPTHQIGALVVSALEIDGGGMYGNVTILLCRESDILWFKRLRYGARHGTLILCLRRPDLNHVWVESADQNGRDHFQVVCVPAKGERQSHDGLH